MEEELKSIRTKTRQKKKVKREIIINNKKKNKIKMGEDYRLSG